MASTAAVESLPTGGSRPRRGDVLETPAQGLRQPSTAVPPAGDRAIGVVASDWIAPLLAAQLRGSVVGVGPRAVYLRCRHPGGRAGDVVVVAVEGHDAIGLPCGVRLPAQHAGVLTRLSLGQPVVTARGTMAIGSTMLRASRWQRVTPVLAAPGREELRSRLAVCGFDERRWPPALGPVPDHLLISARALARHALGRGHADSDPCRISVVVAGLVGWGVGATPSGDDLLAGFTATLMRLAVPAVRSRAADIAARARVRATESTTDLSRTLLACAADGAMALPAAAFLHMITSVAPAQDQVSAALHRLLQVGSTSGRDLAVGILAGLAVVAGMLPAGPTDGTRRARPDVAPSSAPRAVGCVG